MRKSFETVKRNKDAVLHRRHTINTTLVLQ